MRSVPFESIRFVYCTRDAQNSKTPPPRQSKRMSMGGANDEDLAPINNVVKCSNKLGRYEYDEFGVAKFRKAMLVQLKARAEMDIPL